MYDSNNESIFIDPQTKIYRTEILSRLYGMEFNLIPLNGKKPCVEWKRFQTERVTLGKIKEWMRCTYPITDRKNI